MDQEHTEDPNCSTNTEAFLSRKTEKSMCCGEKEKR